MSSESSKYSFSDEDALPGKPTKEPSTTDQVSDDKLDASTKATTENKPSESEPSRERSLTVGSYSFYEEKPNRESQALTGDPVSSRRGTEVAITVPIPNEISPLGLTRKQIGIIFIGLMLAMFIAALDNNIVSTALPSIVGEFGRLDLYSWVVTAYLLTSTATVPLSGRLSDIFGRKIILMGCIVIFLIGSILCGAANSMIMLIVCRAIQGIGGGAMITLALVVISDIVTLRERGRWTGVMGMTFALSSVLGPVLGGIITSSASWRWVFYINIPIGIVALLVIGFSLKLPETKSSVPISTSLRLVDYPGVFTIVVGVILVLLGASLGGNQYAWNSPPIICFFVIGGIILVIFIVLELRAKEPIIRMSTFLFRNVVISDTVAFLVGFNMFGSLTYMPIYFQVIHGDSALTSGLKLLPIMIGLFILSIVSGLLITQTGYFYPYPVIGCALLTLGSGLVGGLLTVDIDLVLLSFFIFLIGMGIGSCLQTLTVVVQNSVERKEMAQVTATQSFLRTMGGVLGVTIFGVIINNNLTANIDPAYLPAVYAGNSVIVSLGPTISSQILQVYNSAIQQVFWVGTAVSGVAFFLALAIKNIHIKKGVSSSEPAEVVGA